MVKLKLDYTIHCGRCGFLYEVHPQPPDTNYWVCPDDVITFLIWMTTFLWVSTMKHQPL